MKIDTIQLWIILFQLILIGFQFYESSSLGVTFGVCCLLIICLMLNTIKEQPHAENQRFSDTSRADALQRKQEQKIK